jgi:hypothetical protein
MSSAEEKRLIEVLITHNEAVSYLDCHRTPKGGSSANLVKPDPEAQQIVEVGRAKLSPLVAGASNSPKVRMSRF